MGRSTIEDKWKKIADATKEEAKSLPQGKQREALLKKARQLEIASQLNEWLTSPGLRSPQ